MTQVTAEDWSELDALVDAELDLIESRHGRPVVEPEVTEALFLEQATTFLSRHAEPQRLIAVLAERFATPPAADPAPLGAEGEEAGDEPA